MAEPGPCSRPFASPARQVAFLLAACFAGGAHASYGQMRLDGIGMFLAFTLVVGWGLILDLVILAPAQVLRRRGAAVACTVIGGLIVLLFLAMLALPAERAGFFKGPPLDSALAASLATCAVFLPFILFAPWAQHRALAEGLARPRWVRIWMWAQPALLVAAVVLPLVEGYFYFREYEAGRAEGAAVQAGGAGALLERASQRGERIWATPLTLPGPARPPSDPYGPRQAWIVGIASGLDESGLVRGDEPFSPEDRSALETLATRYFGAYSAPRVRAHLIWDELAPGNFATVLARDRSTEEIIMILLDRFDRGGVARFCAEGRMPDADRAALATFVAGHGGNSEDYARRIRSFCTSPG